MNIIKDFSNHEIHKILNLKVYEDKKSTIKDIIIQSDDFQEDVKTFSILDKNISEDQIAFLWAYRIYLTVKKVLSEKNINGSVRYEDLDYAVAISIATNHYIDPDEHNITTMQDILLCADDVLNDVGKHPDFIEGGKLVGKSPIWKDLMAEAEWEVSSKYAHQIYLQIEEAIKK